MAYKIIKNITTGDSGSGITSLVKKGSRSGGGVQSMRIANTSTNPATGVCVDYYDGSTAYYLIKGVTIPVGAALSLSGLSFDQRDYSLRVHNGGSSPSITVMVK